jgi:hypothetical protein
MGTVPMTVTISVVVSAMPVTSPMVVSAVAVGSFRLIMRDIGPCRPCCF